MSVYSRYFKVTAGPLIEAIQQVKELNQKARILYAEIVADVGAKPGFYVRDHKLVGFQFDSADTSIYKKTGDGGWYPKKNTKAGKALNKRLDAIKTAPEERALRLVGLHEHPSIFMGNTAYCSTVIVIPSTPLVLFIQVPWYDESPDRMAEYIKDKEAGTSYNATLDALLWKPANDMNEVKKWEFEKAVDEWNESLEAA